MSASGEDSALRPQISFISRTDYQSRDVAAVKLDPPGIENANLTCLKLGASPCLRAACCALKYSS